MINKNYHLYIDTYHRDLDNSVFVSLSRELFCFDYLCTVLSHMLGHVTSSTNGQPYTIKINQDFLMRLLKRGEVAYILSYFP